jgi:hypothetical protein
VYYLNWDVEPEFDRSASELFHQLHVGDVPGTVTQDEFDDMYRTVRELPYDDPDPEQLWRGWNRGSGRESKAFLSTRYCDPCSQPFTSIDDAYHHFYHDHYTAERDTDLAQFFDVIRGVRSMSVGDVVEMGDGEAYHMAASIGWTEFDVIDNRGGSDPC